LIESLPIRLKIRLFGEEFEITTYNTVKVKKIQTQIAEIFGVD